jgi:GNAT superfamily N-acetyltransferase
MRLLKSLFYQLSDTFKTFKEKGMCIGLARLRQTIVRIFYVRRERWVFALPLSESMPVIEPLSGLVVRQVKDKRDLALTDSMVDTMDAVWFRRMFDDGDIAFFALLDGQLVGWGWISFKINPELHHMQAPLLPGDACLHNLFVVPAYRGERIAQRLIAHRLQFLREHRYKRSVISCAKDDIPPLIVAERAGYVKIGESCHTRFLFWDRLDYKPCEAEERYRVQTALPADEAG